MAEREWKPGDLAMVTIRRRRPLRDDPIAPKTYTAMLCKYGWQSAESGGLTGDEDEFEITRRPLVVIDPEDRAQVALVLSRYHSWKWTAEVAEASITDMQAALRSLLAPPKPDEPTGLGAVVEDAEGRRWVRARETTTTAHWKRADGFGQRLAYDKVNAVRVLSLGVEVTA